MSLSVAAAEAQVGQLPDVHVVGNDYAFLHPPDTVAAGQTTFSFENRGTVRHELGLALLGPSATLKDLLDVYQNGGARRGIVAKSIGVLVAAPNDTSGGRLVATLIPGRTYAIVCTLRDKPDAQQHVMLGMLSAFVVK